MQVKRRQVMQLMFYNNLNCHLLIRFGSSMNIQIKSIEMHFWDHIDLQLIFGFENSYCINAMYGTLITTSLHSQLW